MTVLQASNPVNIRKSPRISYDVVLLSVVHTEESVTNVLPPRCGHDRHAVTVQPRRTSRVLPSTEQTLELSPYRLVPVNPVNAAYML